MDQIRFGRTGLQVSRLGLGAGAIGDSGLSDQSAELLLETAVRSGVTTIDTAIGYGNSEARIGKFLSRYKGTVVISTKVGYGVSGTTDWTGPCVMAGIEQSLCRLKVSTLDIVHLHSCPSAVLERGECTAALEEARKQGKIRVAAYSGENEDLAFAVASGRFQAFQTSLNVCDQQDLNNGVVDQILASGSGLIAKRPMANAPWRFKDRPVGHYAEAYWLRWQPMSLQTGIAPDELALRFAVFHTGAHTAIAGTANPEHLLHNVHLVSKGPLPEDIAALVRLRFRQENRNWRGEV